MKKGIHELSTAAFNARMAAAWIKAASVYPEAAKRLPKSLLADAEELASRLTDIFKQLAGGDHEHNS